MSRIYIIKCNEYIKVGISNDPKRRLKDLQTSNPYKLKLLSVYQPKQPVIAERVIHALLDKYHERGEWFNCSFDIADKVITEFCELTSDQVKQMKVDTIDKADIKKQYKAFRRENSYTLKKETKTAEIEITDKVLESIMTRGCGMPKSKAGLLGLKFPLKRGWRKKVIGLMITSERYSLLTT